MSSTTPTPEAKKKVFKKRKRVIAGDRKKIAARKEKIEPIEKGITTVKATGHRYGGGAPKKIVDLKKVEHLAARGLTIQQIADALDIGLDTLAKRRRETPALVEAIARGQAKGIAIVTNNLFEQSADGNVAASIFYLKNRAGWTEKQIIDSTVAQTTSLTLKFINPND